MPETPIYRWIWRWHGFAGLFVVPFIFYMSLTGLPYLWERELDALLDAPSHALIPQETRISYQAQMEFAQAAHPGLAVLSVTIEPDPRTATRFLMGDRKDPLGVSVNPYTGALIGEKREWFRIPYVARQLHGLTMIEPYGSWVLELLACWGIVLCVTGIFLWWPRGIGKLWGAFLVRWRNGDRTGWRDLHAVTGFYFSVVLVLYLATGLPWTAFWGGKILDSMLNSAGQGFPMTLTDFSGLKSAPPAAGLRHLPLDEFVQFGMAQGLSGPLEVSFPPDPEGAVHVHNRLRRSLSEKHFHLDRYTAKPAGEMNWAALPAAQKVISLGINMHEGGLFGRANQIGATVLSGAFMLVSAAGLVMWWKRRPRGTLDFSMPSRAPALSAGLRGVILVLGVLMPLVGLTLLLVAFLHLASRGKGQIRNNHPSI